MKVSISVSSRVELRDVRGGKDREIVAVAVLAGHYAKTHRVPCDALDITLDPST